MKFVSVSLTALNRICKICMALHDAFGATTRVGELWLLQDDAAMK